VNNSFYAFSGESAPGKLVDQFFVYEFPSKTWFPLKVQKDPNGNPDITPRTRTTTIVYGDYIWIFGGTKSADPHKAKNT
jgi:hypothetical protein